VGTRTGYLLIGEGIYTKCSSRTHGVCQSPTLAFCIFPEAVIYGDIILFARIKAEHKQQRIGDKIMIILGGEGEGKSEAPDWQRYTLLNRYPSPNARKYRAACFPIRPFGGLQANHCIGSDMDPCSWRHSDITWLLIKNYIQVCHCLIICFLSIDREPAILLSLNISTCQLNAGDDGQVINNVSLH
jgi:hypothetical protein